ncbi:hypothetical protein [Halobellus ruber]|uniref:hypothetical protein n=1 Tax=Halobellus ruber TaxID=2761102 RepID=UPI001C88EC6B|nr:hypothetical protein [Halobellus ruber]
MRTPSNTRSSGTAGCIVSKPHIRASPNTPGHCIDPLRPKVLVVDESTAEMYEERLKDEIDTDLDAVVTTGSPQQGYEAGYDSFLANRPTKEPDVRFGKTTRRS